MIIEFDAQEHVYYVDGVKVPSVTQLVAPLGEDIDEGDDLELTFEAAADRGVTMHAYIAHRLEGGRPEDFELPGAYADYADSVEQFLSEHRIEPYAIEAPLGCAEFAGTPDLVCEFDGATAILDYKFVSTVAKSKVGAQLGGYKALCELNGIFPDELYAVQFTRDGYRLYPVDHFGAAEAWEECLKMRELKTMRHPRGRIFTRKDVESGNVEECRRI